MEHLKKLAHAHHGQLGFKQQADPVILSADLKVTA
jgi:hypothetical protein